MTNIKSNADAKLGNDTKLDSSDKARLDNLYYGYDYLNKNSNTKTTTNTYVTYTNKTRTPKGIVNKKYILGTGVEYDLYPKYIRYHQNGEIACIFNCDTFHGTTKKQYPTEFSLFDTNGHPICIARFKQGMLSNFDIEYNNDNRQYYYHVNKFKPLLNVDKSYSVAFVVFGFNKLRLFDVSVIRDTVNETWEIKNTYKYFPNIYTVHIKEYDNDGQVKATYKYYQDKLVSYTSCLSHIVDKDKYNEFSAENFPFIKMLENEIDKAFNVINDQELYNVYYTSVLGDQYNDISVVFKHASEKYDKKHYNQVANKLTITPAWLYLLHSKYNVNTLHKQLYVREYAPITENIIYTEFDKYLQTIQTIQSTLVDSNLTQRTSNLTHVDSDLGSDVDLDLVHVNSDLESNVAHVESSVESNVVHVDSPDIKHEISVDSHSYHTNSSYDFLKPDYVTSLYKIYIDELTTEMKLTYNNNEIKFPSGHVHKLSKKQQSTYDSNVCIYDVINDESELLRSCMSDTNDDLKSILNYYSHEDETVYKKYLLGIINQTEDT